MRVGIVGLGFGLSVHFPVFHDMPGVTVVAVVGTNKEKVREKLVSHKEVVACSNVNELLEQNPDVVSVAVPPDAAMEVIVPILQRGIPVLAEKPLAGNVKDAEVLVTLSKGLLTAVDFQFAELDSFKSLYDLLSKKTAGNVRHVHIEWLVESHAQKHHKVSWKTTNGGGVLPLLASHSFYLIEWLFGSVKSINGTLGITAKEGWNLKENTLATDLVRMEMTMSNNAPLTATIGNANPGMSVHRWTVVCDYGSYVIENTSQDYMSGFTLTYFSPAGPDGGEKLAIESVLQETDARLMTFQRLATRFINAYANGLPMKPDFSDGFRVQLLSDLLLQSSQKGQPISIN